jgi:penicillin-binding protein 1C
VFLAWYIFFSLPDPLFSNSSSTILLSEEDILLGGVIADDEQWRFPLTDSVSNKVEQCILHFEDEYFRYHFGFNPVSLSKAFVQNIKTGGIVSGASTITMQTVRMAKGTPQRNYLQKLIEIIVSTRVELKYSKDEILRHYLSNAPFGGNVVGIDAAAWRYYRRMSNELSWGEAATLAVLPNAPSLIYPGKNQEKLRKKRNRLLFKLLKNEVIDQFTYELAIEEPLPQKPNAMPQDAPHLLQKVKKDHPGERVNSSIRYEIQQKLNQVIRKYHNSYKTSEIHNMAGIVVEVKSAKVLAYAGNTYEKANDHANKVDIVQAYRSSGSILKPFLHERMLSEGQLLPKMLLPDVPYRDIKNYSELYEGAVPADEALARSLNIPASVLLGRFGLTKFKNELKDRGFTQFTKSSTHYGLSMVIGGGEVSLFELAQAYCNMASNLNVKTDPYKFTLLNYTQSSSERRRKKAVEPYATYLTVKALKEVVRPSSEVGWQNFEGTGVAWKTGTSHGFKDAWAVAITPEIIIAIWVGNADGEGRPGMTGTKVAAPVLFDMLDYFRPLAQFNEPAAEKKAVEICTRSGYFRSEHCESHSVEVYPSFLADGKLCPFHRTLYLDTTLQYRVNSKCYEVSQMVKKKQFVLPPKLAWFYQRKHPNYFVLPPYFPGCESGQGVIDLIYPRELSSIYLPVALDGRKQSVIFEAVYANRETTLYWHVDEKFITESKGSHRVALNPLEGVHKLTITDAMGNELIRKFEIMPSKQ